MITLLDLCKNQNIKLVLNIRDLCQLLSVLTESRLPPTYAYTLATITKILAPDHSRLRKSWLQSKFIEIIFAVTSLLDQSQQGSCGLFAKSPFGELREAKLFTLLDLCETNGGLSQTSADMTAN